MFRSSAGARAAALTCATAAMALAGGARAQALPSYFLTLTETATGLQVTSNLPTYDNYDPNVFYADIYPATQSNSWRVGPQPSGFQEFSPTDGVPGSAIYNSIAWADPGTGNYNVLNFAPSGNLGDITFAVVSDVTAGGLFGFYNYGGFGTPNVNFHQSCLDQGGFADICPILAAGATFVTPISVLFGTSQASLSVTYIDHDGLGGGVPEPAGWALMIAGFGLAGAALRRRRARGAEILGTAL